MLLPWRFPMGSAARSPNTSAMRWQALACFRQLHRCCHFLRPRVRPALPALTRLLSSAAQNFLLSVYAKRAQASTPASMPLVLTFRQAYVHCSCSCRALEVFDRMR